MRPLDGEFPPHERLPRYFVAEISQIDGAGVDGRASLSVDGLTIGDDLRDNAWHDDGYRYHDVFHLSHAAVLGWSPCLRRMLKRKRKSVPRVDEVEDGARAILLEEAIVTLMFDYCSSHGWLDDDAPIDASFVSMISRLTSKLECAGIQPGEWERAMRDGARAWKTLRRRGSAVMVGDLLNQRLLVANSAH
jgi:hypothetical protein